MTYINDIPEGEVRERLRAEVLGNVEHRSEESLQWQTESLRFVGLVTSGATVAVLGFIASRGDLAPEPWSALSLGLLIASLLAHAYGLYSLAQLHALRWSDFAEKAQEFFQRERSLEEVLNATRDQQSALHYRLLFYVPFFLLLAGLALGATAAFLASAGGTQAFKGPFAHHAQPAMTQRPTAQ